MYVVATGTAFDGLVLHGPFATYEMALEWAKPMEDYELVAISPPSVPKPMYSLDEE